MKLARSAFTLALLALPVTSMAAERFFIRTLGGPDNHRIRAVATLGDRIYFAGANNTVGLDAEGLLVTTTADGEIVSEATFVDPGGRPVEFTAMVAGDGVLHVGGNRGDSPNAGDAFVMTLSPLGAILSQTVLTAEKENFLNDLIVTADGGLLVVGRRVVAGETAGFGWVAKLDAAGALEWEKEIGSGGIDTLNGAAERDGGGFVLAGGLSVASNPFGVVQGWLVELDAGGNLVWQQAYVAATGDSFSDVLLERDRIIAVGTFCDFCFFRGDGWIVNTDSTGGLLEASFIGDFNFQGFDEIVEAVPAVKGQGFTVFGSTDTIIGPMQQMWAARFDNRGQLRWVRQVGGAGFEVAGGLATLPTGSIAFGGYIVSNLEQDGYIGKLDRGGRRPGSCPDVDITAENAFRDDGGLTVAVRTVSSIADADSVALPGTLAAGISSTIVDRLVCLE